MNRLDQRKGMYAKIAIARKQIGMDDDTYREKLRNEYGVASSKDLSDARLARLVQSLAALGATFTSKGGASGRNARVKPHSRPDWVEITDSMLFAAEKRQIAAIWKKLGYSLSSLDTRVKRAFGVDLFVWLHDGEQIATLLCDLQRREKAFDRKNAQTAREAGVEGTGTA